MIQGVPKNYRSAALAAFVRELRDAPTFANNRIIKTWLTWSTAAPMPDPPVSKMPACQVRWIGGEAKRIASTRVPGGAATSATEIRPTIAIELWTPGCDQADALDLADLIYDTLAPQDQTARKALQTRLGAVGIRDWRLAREIAPPSLDSFGTTQIYSAGAYELTIMVAS